ncbi:MAG: matrix protein [Wufeng shrew rhabdovirus 7]|nr:MAG: matrix protein [Wufeng shrew rhabdovirus 7]
MRQFRKKFTPPFRNAKSDGGASSDESVSVPKKNSDLPPGYHFITPPILTISHHLSVPQQKNPFRLSYTYLIKIRISPMPEGTFEMIMPDLLKTINKVSNSSIQMKRLLGAIIWAVKPGLMPKAENGILVKECFKTGKVVVDVMTRDPNSNIIITTSRTEAIAGEFRSIDLQLSLFKNMIIEGPNVTGDIVNGKTQLLGNLVQYNVCEGPGGYFLDFEV